MTYSSDHITGNIQSGGVVAGLASATYQALASPAGTERPEAKPSSRISGTTTTAQRNSDILSWPLEAIPPTSILRIGPFCRPIRRA